MRIVVKVGTSTLMHLTGKLNIRRIGALCETLSDFKNSGHEIVLVSSGAISMGVSKLALEKRPSDMPTKQAAAAVGQCELMYTYDKLFSEYRHTVAQILLTESDVDNEEHCRNFRATLSRLLELGVLPIINENDTVATQEISIGDNDTLGAIVAVNAGADLLVLLSDIDGFYTADPKKDPQATLVRDVREITDELRELATGSRSSFGTGGMVTKLRAAEIAGRAGIETVLVNGEDPKILYRVVSGDPVGTRFYGRGCV